MNPNHAPPNLPRTRLRMEAFEVEHLASYAQKSADSAGRVHPEEKHPFRTDYQRDRARVIHSKAFRRLESKTQVFLNGSGDHFRTRLTHTMEVASISRTIARGHGGTISTRPVTPHGASFHVSLPAMEDESS